jgi:probable F420-dependent oxidoreductase
MRFGVSLPNFGSGVDAAAVADWARAAEAAGWDGLFLWDHLFAFAESPVETVDPWIALTAAACATTTIRLGTLVTPMPRRRPVVVARQTVTLDRLSGGRLILGLGGGASDEEFRAFGIGVPSPRDKVDGLAEAIEIMRGLWTEPALTYPGRLHRAVAAPMEPKPVRRIPIWLGTFGPRALAVTGRLADGWMPSLGYAPLEQLPVMRDRIAAAAEQAGRSIDDVTCALNVEVRATDLEKPDRLAERLRALTAMGFTVLNLKPTGPGRAEVVERLAREVLPTVI